MLLLTNETIAANVEKAREFLEKNRVARQNITRICLAVEEVLLEYQTKLGNTAPVELICGKRLGYANVILQVRGESIDPFTRVKEDEIPLRYLLPEMDYYPTWSYKKGSNVVRFEVAVQKKDKTLAFMLSAVVFGAVFGILAKQLPGNACQVLCDSYLSPVSSTILGLLGTLATLLIFVSVVAGICGIGDISTFNKIGKRMIFRFLLFMMASALLCLLLCLTVFPLQKSGSAKLDFAVLWKMVLGIVPTNILDAFLTGNALQVVFVAIFVGIVMLSLSSKVEKMVEWNMTANIIVQKTLQIVIKTMPLVVFISIFKLTATSSLSNFAGVYKYPLLMLICCVANLIVFILRVSITQHVGAGLVIKKLLPTFVIAVTTASSSAAFSTNLDTCENKLGIDRQIANIGVPLGQTLFKPPIIFSMICGSFCLAQLYGGPLTFPQMVTMLLSVYILAIAAPPVPGVGISCFTLLFAQLGIPAEAVSVVIALDVLIDRISTSTGLAMVQTELVQLASSLKMLNEEKLKAN